jgi:hypothetical protein
MNSNLTDPLKGKQTADDKKEDRACLQAVAPTNQLDSFPPKRDQPAASPISSNELIAEQAGTTVQALLELRGWHCQGYYRGGLNE